MDGFCSATFMEHVNQLAATSLAKGQSTYLTGLRSWNTPIGTYSGDPLEIEGIEEGYFRNDLNEAYSIAINTSGENSGRIGTCMAFKAQVDWLAIKERAYRFRHATSIRCAMHSAGRQTTRGSGRGTLYGGLVGTIQDLIASSYNDGDSGVG